MRRQLRAGQALRTADLAKPDLVQRDDNVTLIYESAGLYLTIRGKAMDKRHRRRRRQRAQPAIQAHDVRRRDRPRTGRDHGRNAAASRRRRSIHRRISRHRIRFQSPPATVRQSLQKPSNVHVHVKYQSYRPHRHLADHRQRRGRLFVDRPAFPDRRAAETVGDRKSDDAARLQAGADADAEAGSGVLQRQFTVAERLAVVLQGSARASDRRSPDRHRQHHRSGQFRQRDPAQPHQHGRFGHHRLPRQQPADRQGRRSARAPSDRGLPPPPTTARARSSARKASRPTSPPSSPSCCRTAIWWSKASRRSGSISKSAS